MKKLLIGVLLLSLCATVAFAAVSTERGTTVLHQSKTDYEYIQDSRVHRVVTGYAEARISPNFYHNDWDNRSGYTSWAGSPLNPGDPGYKYHTAKYELWNIATPEEAAYLQSIPEGGFTMERRTTYYVDMTGQVWGTSPFTDYSEESYDITTVVEFINLDPYTVIELTKYHIIQYTTDVVYEIVANMYDYSPLVLDLNQDGRIDVARNQWLPHAPKFYREFALHFDMTGSGSAEFTEWMSPNSRDGMLVMPNAQGKVEGALELFGTAGGFTDGFEKLSMICDHDNNGWVEGKELEGLKIWIDANHNGICEPEELHELSDFGITRISTRHENYVSSYQTADGSEHTLWDWWPASMEIRKFRR